MKPYQIVNDEVVQLNEGPYEGVTYKYGRVQFKPNEHDDNLTISFSYDIMDGPAPDDRAQFEQYIGAILHEIIEEQLGRNDVVYTGGV
jgi:hypothetical protein